MVSWTASRTRVLDVAWGDLGAVLEGLLDDGLTDMSLRRFLPKKVDAVNSEATGAQGRVKAAMRCAASMHSCSVATSAMRTWPAAGIDRSRSRDR
jgi:hypothetical protein